MEFQAIYNNRDKVVPVLEDMGITFTELHYPQSFEYMFCQKPVKKKDGSIQYGYSWCGGMARWGTDRKNSIIKKHYASIQLPIKEYIGIAADEEPRITRALDKGKILPLVDAGMKEEDALQFCYDRGYSWEENGIELYSILDRVSCWCCRNNNLKELRNMYHYLPDYWAKLKQLQEKTSLPYKNYTKNGIPYGTIEELEQKFKEENVQI